MAGIVPAPAATVTLVRDGPQGLEVLMMRRNLQSKFVPGKYVFPGGSVDESDSAAAIYARCAGLDDAAASRRLGLASNGLAYWIAAIRESFEEAGLLLARNADGEAIAQARAVELSRHRKAVAAGELAFDALLDEAGLSLPVDELVYFSHWITPMGAPRRYDTRFFVARAPAGQQPVHDNEETIESAWVRPREGVERYEKGLFKMLTPTIHTLRSFAAYESALDLIDAMRALPAVPTIAPRLGTDGRRIMPGEPGYDEMAGRERGTVEALKNIVPGEIVRVSALVRRVTAPNPGMMTGPGTNTYVIGDDALALIDPGPDSAAHLDAMLDAVGGKLRWILCTHTHLDHSPGARALKAATRAEVIGMRAPPHGSQDAAFAPDRVPMHGEVLDCGAFALQAVHTPGHASNHLCYLLESEKLLFTGDHVMQGSTVVISPPDGDMTAYLTSLQALLALDLARIAPGHGHPIDAPHDEARRLVAHRLKREQKVVAAFAAKNPATLDELLPVVYADTPQALHPVARRSLHAHLLKLEREGRVRQDGEYWRRH